MPYSGPIDSMVEHPRFCVAGYVGKASVIEIPSNFKNGVIVAIGSNAFKDNKEIVSINLPKTITVIEEYAFSNCASLRSINLDNIRYMQDYVFENCVSLEMVNLPNLSTTVHGGEYYYSRFAFSSCDNLKIIKVGTKSYGRYYGTFVKDCPRLEKFIVCCTSISSSFVISTPNLKLACLGVSLTNPNVSTTTVPFPDLENLKIIIANNDNIRLYNYENATIYRYGRFVGYNSDFLAALAYPTTLFDYLGDYNPLVIPYKYTYYDNSTQYVLEQQAVVKCIDIDEFENFDKIAYFEGSYEIWNGIEKKQNVNYDVAFYNETGKNMDSELLYWRYVNNVPTLW